MAVGLPLWLLLGADIVHLGLLLDELAKLAFHCCDLRLQLRRCSLLLDLCCELLALCGLVGLLLGLSQPLVADAAFNRCASFLWIFPIL